MDCVDDMFLFVGIELARKLARRNFCEEKREANCLIDGDTPIQLRKWLSLYDRDIMFVNERSTGKVIYFYGQPLVGSDEMENTYQRYKTDFCQKYLLFRKSSARYMYEMDRDNGRHLGDSSRNEITEQDIMNADNYTTYA